jgi:hypothetical protein
MRNGKLIFFSVYRKTCELCSFSCTCDRKGQLEIELRSNKNIPVETEFKFSFIIVEKLHYWYARYLQTPERHSHFRKMRDYTEQLQRLQKKMREHYKIQQERVEQRKHDLRRLKDEEAAQMSQIGSADDIQRETMDIQSRIRRSIEELTPLLKLDVELLDQQTKQYDELSPMFKAVQFLKRPDPCHVDMKKLLSSFSKVKHDMNRIYVKKLFDLEQLFAHTMQELMNEFLIDYCQRLRTLHENRALKINQALSAFFQDWGFYSREIQTTEVHLDQFYRKPFSEFQLLDEIEFLTKTLLQSKQLFSSWMNQVERRVQIEYQLDIVQLIMQVLKRNGNLTTTPDSTGTAVAKPHQ